MATRLTDKVARADKLTLNVNGNIVSAFAGETIAAVLFAENVDIFYKTKDRQPRAPFCNMGTCYECLVHIKRANSDDSPGWVRSCMTEVEQDMIIETGGQMQLEDSENEQG